MSSAAKPGNEGMRRLVAFLATGVLNTLFGYAVYAVLVYFNTPYLLALLLSTVAGVAFNFFSYGKLVFGTKPGWRIFGKFIIAYALIYGFNAWLLTLLTQDMHWSPYVAQGACLFPTVALSWVLMNLWVYKGSKP